MFFNIPKLTQAPQKKLLKVLLKVFLEVFLKLS